MASLAKLLNRKSMMATLRPLSRSMAIFHLSQATVLVMSPERMSIVLALMSLKKSVMKSKMASKKLVKRSRMALKRQVRR